MRVFFLILLALNFLSTKPSIADSGVYTNEEEFFKALRRNTKVIQVNKDRLTPEELQAQEKKFQEISQIVKEYIVSQIGTKEETPSYEDYKLTEEEAARK